MSKDVSRRKFVQDAGLTTMALGLSPQFIKAQSSAKKDKVRLGIIGTGYRGQSHIEMLIQRTDTVIVAFGKKILNNSYNVLILMQLLLQHLGNGIFLKL